MPYNNKVDEYIENAKPFARPILRRLRKLVHQACPRIEENIKWGMPYFEYKGIVCHMAAFNQHCAFGFWKAALMKDARMLIANNGVAMGHSGKIKSLDDLPPDKDLLKKIKEAVQLNVDGQQLPSGKRNSLQPVLPEILTKKFSRSKKDEALFLRLPASHQKEYVDWINEAINTEIQRQRVEKMLQWIQKGKKKTAVEE